jgi:hypothetical protein
MKYLKIYEDFEMENIPSELSMNDVHFETESSEIYPLDSSEGNYKVNFKNSEGEDTTIEIGGADNPEFMGEEMISSIQMVPDSSSDGKNYSITGYYEIVPDTHGAYELKKVLIQEEK